jgi:hypothetical protein
MPRATPNAPAPAAPAGTISGDLELARFLAQVPEEARARFAEAGPAVQAQIRGFALAGPPDRILIAEACKLLRPPRAAPPPPASLPELLERLPGGPPAWVASGARWLAEAFGTPRDHELWPAFHRLLEAVWARRYPAGAVLEALGKAEAPGVKNRGAIFNVELRKRGWPQ